MIETARKEDLFLDKKLIIPENRLDAIRIMARLHPVVGDQPTNEKDQPNTNNPVLDLACTILNIHEKGIGVHADLRPIQNEPPFYFYGKGFMSGTSSLKGNGILAVYGQWRDGSGRYAIKQFYYTDKEIVWRNAISDTAWSQWFDVLTSNSDLDYNKLLNVPITSTLSDSKTQIASIFAVNNVNRVAVNAQKTANTANANAVDAMNEALKKMDVGYMGLGRYAQVMGAEFTDFYSFPLTNPEFDNFQYQTGFYTLSRQMVNGWKNNGGSATYTCVLQVIRRAYLAGTALVLIGYEANRKYINERHSNGIWQGWREDYSTYNTTVGNHGQLHDGSGTPKELVAIEDSGVGTSALTRVNTSNFRRGIYYDSPNVMDDASVSTNNIVIGGQTGSAGGAIYIDRYGNIRSYGRYSGTWSSAVIPFSNKNTTSDPAGFLRSFGNAVALTTDKLTSDLKVNRSDLVASAKYAYDVYQAALAADKKAANAQARADSAFSKVKPISEGGTGATTAANARKNLGHGDASTRNVATSLESNGNTLVPLSLMNNSMFGVGQKWVDVTGQRMSKSTYKNDTGKPICLSLWMKQEWQGSKVFTVFIDGINVVRSDTGTSSDPSVFAIIPAGSTYKVEIDGVSLGANAFWFEMR